MPLDTTAKRRSSVGLLQPWQPNIPSPLESPGAVDQADQQQMAWTYSGILAGAPLPAAIIIFGTWVIEPVLAALWHVEPVVAGTCATEPVVGGTVAVQPADALVGP